jgi:hypothetical protein
MPFIERVADMKQDWALYSPLMHAAVIAYGRPFTESDGGSGTLKKCWRECANAEYRDLHRRVIDARNKIVARSDPTVREVVVYPAPMALPDGIKPQFNLRVRTHVFEREDMGMLANLAFMLGKHLDWAINLALPVQFADRTFGDPFALHPRHANPAPREG